ncbi:hypothetical protein EsDP_00004382 [Epichloe bromicola]|uniref:Uncharacterized protein n=1 Tax=Epichloe bromicola TaxID=79588 RepID=A0ABQ0CRJ3_9HYPO
MEDRRLTTHSPTAISTLGRPSGGDRRPGGAPEQPVTPRHTRVVRPDGAYWAHLDEDDILQPLDALGISNSNTKGPKRYALQRGRVVPQRQYPDVHSDGELSPPTPQYKLASSNKTRGSAALQTSPSSSPDVVGDELEAGDVSPIENDSDNVQSKVSTGSRRDTCNLPSQQRQVSSTRLSQAGTRVHNSVPQPRRQVMPPADERVWNQQAHMRQAITYSENDKAWQESARAEHLYAFNTTITSTGNDRTKASSPPSLGQRLRLAGKTKPAAIDSRPRWNGASGRSAMMQPVGDDLHAALLNFPPKDTQGASHAGKSGAVPLGAETLITSTGGNAMRRLLQVSYKNKPKKSTTPPAQSSVQQQPPTLEKAYPSHPHNDILTQEAISYNAPPPDLKTWALGSHPPDPIRPSLNVIKRKPAPTSSHISPASNHKLLDTNLSSGAETPGDCAANLPSDSPSEAAWVPPPSRFSITTYATSNPGTPRVSSEEDVPPLPILPPVLGVMARSRPITGGRSWSSGSEQPVVIEMSSSYTPTEESQRDFFDHRNQDSRTRSISDTESTDRRFSSLSTSKPLPLAPHQGQSGDLVSRLDAQISGLFHLRVNIEKSIKQMTELMPQDNLLASHQVMRKREEEKQKVDNLRQELADIQREEHELGLKLYRARKRQYKDAEFESTPLWVSRVAA